PLTRHSVAATTLSMLPGFGVRLAFGQSPAAVAGSILRARCVECLCSWCFFLCPRLCLEPCLAPLRGARWIVMWRTCTLPRRECMRVAPADAGSTPASAQATASASVASTERGVKHRFTLSASAAEPTEISLGPGRWTACGPARWTACPRWTAFDRGRAYGCAGDPTTVGLDRKVWFGYKGAMSRHP